MKYIDIHCHLNFPEYDKDREEVIARAQKEEIGIINVGVDFLSSKNSIELAESYENIWACVGTHPIDSKGSSALGKFKELAKHPKVVAIGECGLDYFHSKPEDIDKQKEIFIQHILLANELDKPLMLHVRNGKDNINAYKDAVEIMKKHAKVRGNFHFFAGNMEDFKMILDINCTVSFTGVVTFARDYDAVIKYAPIDRIMTETDAPYVSPAPYRGKRNEPLFIKEISHALANIKGLPIEQVPSQFVDNARKMFRI